MRKFKRGLALMLVALMLVTVLPITAMAEDPGVSVLTVQIDQTIDLTTYFEEELKEVPLSRLLPGHDQDLNGVTELAWDNNAYDTVNNFTVVDITGGTIDLSSLISASYYDGDKITYNLEILTNDQLADKASTRYIVPVEVLNLAKVLQLDAYKADKTLISSLPVYSSSSYTYGNQVRYMEYTDLPIWDVRDAVISMKLNDSGTMSTALAGLNAQVYKGNFSTAEEAEASDQEITSNILNKDSEGYSDDDVDWTRSPYPEFTVVLERSGDPVQLLHITAGMSYRSVEFGLDMYTATDDPSDTAKIGTAFYRSYSSSEYSYYVDPDYTKWQSGDATLKLRYRNSSDGYGTDYSEYEITADASVYTGYYRTEAALSAAIEAGTAEDITDKIWGDSSEGWTDDYTDWMDRPAFTVVVGEKDSGKIDYVVPFYVYMPAQQLVRVYVNYALMEQYSSGSSTNYRDVSGLPQISNVDPDSYYFTMLWPTYGQPYTAYGEYYVRFYVEGGESAQEAIAEIESIYMGDTEVTSNLFASGGSSRSSQYYQVDFSEANQPVTFTVTYTDGTEQIIKLRTVPAQPPANTSSGSTDTYFSVESVKIGDNDYNVSSGNAYPMPYYVDSSYQNGFQVLFVDATKDELESGEVEISFSTGTGVRMYVKHDEQGDPLNNTGRSGSYSVLDPVKSGVPILFSAASESGTHLRNYWITLVAKDSGGPQLWVNGQNDEDHTDEATGYPAREVYINGSSGYYDILFANVGDARLEDLEVTLSDSSTIRLDEYWTIGETKTLAAFTDTTPSDALGSSYQQLKNMAKIRIWPESAGDIDAILTIKAKDQESVSIKLTGKVGTSIISSSVSDGVKYVPYSCLIQTNFASSSTASNRPTFRIESGVLPQGVDIRQQTGEIYGVPQVWSSSPFTFTVGMYQSGQLVDTKTFTMTIAENTDENVWNASDITYEVEQAIGMTSNQTYHYVIDLASHDGVVGEYDRTFISKGPYIYHEKVFLDGRELTEGGDYTRSEGSDKIVLQEGTLGNINGTHTLAIEFREGGSDGTLKRTAQNYTIEGGINPPPPQQSGSSSGSTGGQTPSTPPSKTFPFVDVTSSDWEYDDVFWVWDKELMTGVTSTTFEPDTYVSQAMIVVTLARLGGVDLTAYENVSVDGAAPGAWYSTAAAWAQQTGILPDYTSFSGESGGYSRDGMAIMLVKFLTSVGIDTTVGGDIAFDDMDQMSDAGRDAFRELCHYGIFKGIGDNKMDPGGVTTRAQFAALLHRISNLVANR